MCAGKMKLSKYLACTFSFQTAAIRGSCLEEPRCRDTSRYIWAPSKFPSWSVQQPLQFTVGPFCRLALSSPVRSLCPPLPIQIPSHSLSLLALFSQNTINLLPNNKQTTTAAANSPSQPFSHLHRLQQKDSTFGETLITVVCRCPPDLSTEPFSQVTPTNSSLCQSKISRPTVRTAFIASAGNHPSLSLPHHRHPDHIHHLFLLLQLHSPPSVLGADVVSAACWRPCPLPSAAVTAPADPATCERPSLFLPLIALCHATLCLIAPHC